MTRTYDITHRSPVVATPRVAQIRGLFDLPEGDAVENIAAELPDISDTWTIGLICGASGSGKTSIARAAFPHIYDPHQIHWPTDRSVIDGFPADISIKTITHTLTAVGFSSPPSWLKPYKVLSGGEKMRADLARALIQPPADNLVVYDEFTSVVDRTVAKICSAALAKGIRAGRFTAKRFVAVACHKDISEWLCADWIWDTDTGQLSRRQLRRPPIKITLHPTHRKTWNQFRRHHYLSNDLHNAARAYVGRWNNTNVAFAATLSNLGTPNLRRITRIVTLPDYQGIGIGGALLTLVAQHERKQGYRISITTSHPAMITHLTNSKHWRCTGFRRFRLHDKGLHVDTGGYCRPTASFQFQ